MAWSRRALVLAAITALLILVSLLYGPSSRVLLPHLVQVTSGPRVLTSQISALLYRRTNPPYPKPGSAKPFVRRIVAVGDLHGSMENAEQVLRFSKVVDAKGDWTGDVDFFVQVGDIIDRGPDTIELFDWMDKLREQAKLTGDKQDKVISLLGNHEFMNLFGRWSFVSDKEIMTFGTPKDKRLRKPTSNRVKMLKTGRIGQSWANHYISASRLPLHPSLGLPNTPYPLTPRQVLLNDGSVGIHGVDPQLSHAALAFVHGGLAPGYGCLTPFPSCINRVSKSLLQKLQKTLKVSLITGQLKENIPRDITSEEDEFYGKDGPLRYRGWARDSLETACHDIDQVLPKIGARRMIMGHTTTPTAEIIAACEGKLIFIDTGISRGFQSALSITYTLTPIGDKSGAEQKWMEKEVVEALYRHTRRVTLAIDEREVVGDFRVTEIHE